VSGGYVHELRGLVGRRPLILPGAAVIVYDQRPAILLIRRADTGGWGLPGGYMEPGETLEETGRRELWEETGLVAQEMRQFMTVSGRDQFLEYPNGDQVFNVTTVFTSPRPSSDDRMTVDADEVSDARFFPVTRLPVDILEPELPIIDAYLAGLGAE
jgi:8-oxo-dGTP pyrophosphatase MutT (NUDIX family)